MNLWCAIRSGLRSLLRQRVERSAIDEELSFHVEQRTAENLATGMSAEDAARAARKRFGNVQSIREECRKVRGASVGEELLQDVRFGLRMLRKSPGFASVSVLTLALGVGATTSMSSLIYGVLLTPPPYRNPERLALIVATRVDGQGYPFACVPAQWLEWRQATNSFAVIAGYEWGFQFVVLPDGSESAAGMFVTPEYFDVIGVKPLLGRAFVQSDMASRGGDETVMILGYDLWKRRFNGDPGIIGKAVRLSRRRPMTVVGVMPPGVRFLPSAARRAEVDYDVNAPVDFWVPLWPPDLTHPAEGYCEMVGRLRDGVTPSQAQAEVAALAGRQARADQRFEGLTARAVPLTQELNREGRRVLLPLTGAGVLVFVIACANVAGLLLARGLRRQPEYATRGALGASRCRLLRQALTESGLLAIVGAALGGGVALAVVGLLKAIGSPAIPRVDAVTPGWPAFAACFGSALLAATVAGVLPALRATRLRPAEALKPGGGRTSAEQRERQLLAFVAMFQVALTLALLVGAGLLVRTINNLARLRPGYQTDHILTMSVTIPDDERFIGFHAQLRPRILALPGVRNVALGWGLPLTGNQWNFQAEVEEQPATSALRDKLTFPIRCVTPEYFDTLGIGIVAGRGFGPTDAFYGPDGNTNSTFVAIVNQALADRYFPNQNPLGKKLVLFPGRKMPATIVGVVQDARSESLSKDAAPEIYVSFWQWGFGLFVKHLIVRTAADPKTLAAAVQRELRAIDPTVAIQHVKTFDQIRADSLAPQTFIMRLLLGFSVVGTVLALVGVYGVLSLSAGSRTREIAIRMALGAQRGRVRRMILLEGCALTGAGLVVGMGLALALARGLSGFLFGVGPTDPLTFVGAAVLFAVVASVACYVPARRATRTEPMAVLRYE